MTVHIEAKRDEIANQLFELEKNAPKLYEEALKNNLWKK